MELKRTSQLTDISSTAEVISYTYSDSDPIEIIIRVDIGDSSNPISGNGNYKASVYVDSVLISPDLNVNVASGVTKTILMSRGLAIESGDVVSVKVLGLSGDTNVRTIASIRDVTPAKTTDLIGEGTVIVDHDYGGIDNLRYVTPSGAAIGNAQIDFYLKSEYNAGKRGLNFLRGKARTRSDGRWVNPLNLDAGVYKAVFYKPGFSGPDVVEVDVA